MDAEELVHCHTVARLLADRLTSEISRRFGWLTGRSANSGGVKLSALTEEVRALGDIAPEPEIPDRNVRR